MCFDVLREGKGRGPERAAEQVDEEAASWLEGMGCRLQQNEFTGRFHVGKLLIGSHCCKIPTPLSGRY